MTTPSSSSKVTSSFYNQPTFDTEDIIVAALIVDDSDDEGSSFDPFIDDLPLFSILGAMFEEDKPRVGGSVVGRKYVHRDRQAAHHRLVTDYFATNCRFDGNFFRRRFRMRRLLFNKILKDISAANPFFTQKRDATFRLGITPLVKMISSIRVLSYACAADTLDEWLKIGESTVIDCLNEFCETVINIYAAKFMRIPNEVDIARLLAKG